MNIPNVSPYLEIPLQREEHMKGLQETLSATHLLHVNTIDVLHLHPPFAAQKPQLGSDIYEKQVDST